MEATSAAEWLEIPRAPEEFYQTLRKKVTRVRTFVVSAAMVFGTLIGLVLVYGWPHGAPFPAALDIPVFLVGYAVTALGVWMVERFRILPWMEAWNTGAQVEVVKLEAGRVQIVARAWSWKVRGSAVSRVPVEFAGWAGLRIKHPKVLGKFALLMAPVDVADRIVSAGPAVLGNPATGPGPVAR
jgi:hypothetical protein